MLQIEQHVLKILVDDDKRGRVIAVHPIATFLTVSAKD
jgi:hypothetical protein